MLQNELRSQTVPAHRLINPVVPMQQSQPRSNLSALRAALYSRIKGNRMASQGKVSGK